MACTGIELPKKEDGSTNRLKVITEVNGESLVINYYACDGDFMPYGAAEVTISDKSEEEFHVKLRADADEKGQLVRNESTDPQWNPGYVPDEEE